MEWGVFMFLISLVLLTKVATGIFLAAVCIFQIILFFEFIYKYRRKTTIDKQAEFHLFDNILYLFIFVNVWIIYFNGGFSLSWAFLSPYDELGEGMIRLFTFNPENPVLFFMLLNGILFILPVLVILYFPITLINLLKSFIKKKYSGEVSELKLAVSMIIITGFTSVLVLQAAVRLSN